MMKNIAALCLAIVFVPALAAEDDPEPKARAVKPREIVVGLPVGVGQIDAPISIPSEKDLVGLVPDKESRAIILKTVDFNKERLLLFWWHGGVGDRLVPLVGKPGEASFEYALTHARRGTYQARLFAVPARAKLKMIMKEE
jgi:hypothetical protein